MRNTWDFRRKDGWILGCSLEHYRCQRVSPKDTKAVQISETHEYRNHYLTQPTLTLEDCVLHILQTLTCALEDAPSQMCEEKLRAISTLQELFGQWTKNDPTYPRQNRDSREPPKNPPKKEKQNKNTNSEYTTNSAAAPPRTSSKGESHADSPSLISKGGHHTAARHHRHYHRLIHRPPHSSK